MDDGPMQDDDIGLFVPDAAAFADLYLRADPVTVGIDSLREDRRAIGIDSLPDHDEATVCQALDGNWRIQDPDIGVDGKFAAELAADCIEPLRDQPLLVVGAPHGYEATSREPRDSSK